MPPTLVCQVLGEEPCAAGVSEEQQAAALDACLAVNAALLHRIVTKKPLGVLKYAMTLDGKIATAQVQPSTCRAGHARGGLWSLRVLHLWRSVGLGHLSGWASPSQLAGLAQGAG